MAFVLPALAAVGSAAAATATTGAAAAAGLETASIPIAGAAAASSWMGYAGLGLSALGGVTGAIGAIQQGQAASEAAKYNASVAASNADMAKRNAQMAGEAGAQQAAMQEQKTRAQVGEIKANQAASGVDVNSGSALDVRSSAAELGELDALTVRTNAAKEAYGYQTQAVSDKAQAGLDRFEAENDETAGELGAASTLLGSAASGASNYYRYKMSGGLGG